MGTELRKLQLVQLEILKVIDDICQKYDIKYSLYAGTLLGAVRHKGFIPWDDDLDICMSRREYNRFIQIWDRVKPEGYILQNKENSPAFGQSFTKIRKEHTTFLQFEWEKNQYHTGIFVDIFPIDRMPEGKLQYAMFKWNCMLYQLYTREYIPAKSGKVTQFATAAILKCTPKAARPKLRRMLLNAITQNNDNKKCRTVAIETMGSLKAKYSVDMLDSYTRLPFEDGEFMCFAGWDEHLKCKFGNYMQLPPESERAWKHHPIILDFERSFEEIG